MTPWELAKTTEHSHQRALFCWANCAALYGYTVANDPKGYVKAERENKYHPLYYSARPQLALLFAIHNQGHGDAIRGGRAKAEGVKAGVPDVMLPVPVDPRDWRDPWNGLFIELKLPNFAPSAVKPKQVEWQDALRQQGYRVEVCGGWQAAAAVIEGYLK